MTVVLSKLQAYLAMAVAALLAVALVSTGVLLVKEKLAHSKTLTALTTEQRDRKQDRVNALEAYNKAMKELRDKQTVINTKYQEALNDARKQADASRRDADAARTESDGLREQSVSAARRIADLTTPDSAVREYAATVNGLFDQCQRAFADMASQASSHANDVRTLLSAWPVSK